MLAPQERWVLRFWSLLGYLALPFAALFCARYLLSGRRGLIRCQQHLALYRHASVTGKTRQVIWIHAVSTGELLSARPLLRPLKLHYPDYRLLLTVGTDEAYRLAEDMIDVDQRGYLPFDSLPLCRKALRDTCPAAVIILETEIWPNFIRAVSERNVPLLLLNARLDDRAYRHYHSLRWLFAPIVKRYSAVLAQTDLDRDRFRVLGVNNARLYPTNNIKAAAAAEAVKAMPSARRDWRRLLRLQESDILLLGGSTYSGEEVCLVQALNYLRSQQQPVRLLLAPRHISRIPSLLRRLRSMDIAPQLRSRLDGAAEPAASVILLDTVGELAQLYAAADIVFIGKTLSAKGGQNPLEAAAWGKAIVFGAHTQNFRGATEQLLQRNAAVRVANTEQLNAALLKLAQDRQRRNRLGTNAEALVREQQGGLYATQRLLFSYIKPVSVCLDDPVRS